MPLSGSPGVVKNRPACRSGIARSASLARATLALIDQTTNSKRTHLRREKMDLRSISTATPESHSGPKERRATDPHARFGSPAELDGKIRTQREVGKVRRAVAGH